ncbi:uncharacterized protein METZ01_LOCUS218140, partial [marine metagenome]
DVAISDLANKFPTLHSTGQFTSAYVFLIYSTAAGELYFD